MTRVLNAASNSNAGQPDGGEAGRGPSRASRKKSAGPRQPAAKGKAKPPADPPEVTDLAQAPPSADGTGDFWELRLYVAGQTPKSLAALKNLKKVCEEHLAGRYRIEVIDLMQQPQLARTDQIVAIPTLVRKLPNPIRKIIGDLSDVERTLVGLQLRPRKADA